ncbi:MAG: hypothetical protein KAW92_11825 [Candidatus Cloacimonetes bacterium]|nr:hypothetical protein [Candidatus Cloacimonadota bacterium]
MGKVVDPDFDHLMTLYCSCPGCEDKLIIKVFKKHYTNDDIFFFEIVYDDPPNLWQRIKRAWKYIRGWKQPELSYDSIMLNVEQAEELSKALYKRTKKWRKETKAFYKRKKEKE